MKRIRVNEVGYTPIAIGPCVITKLVVTGGRPQSAVLYVGEKEHSVFAITKPTLSISLFNRTANKLAVPAGQAARLRLYTPETLEVTVEMEESNLGTEVYAV